MSNSNKTKILLDLGTFAAFLIVMDPRTSGIAIHEWLAFALAATIIIHLLLNWTWLVETTKRVFIGKLNGSRWNYIINWLLFFDGILIMLSGFMISESVAPLLGIALPKNFTWRGIHELSTNLSLLLMGLHVAMHWNWIKTTFKRMVGGSAHPAAESTLTIIRKDAKA